MKKSPEVNLIANKGGPTLGYSVDSGIPIIEENGLKFKNHSRSGKLEPCEDWRLPARQRAEDLAGKLPIEQLLALMMHSGVQSVPGSDGPFTKATKSGVPFGDSGAEAWELTDQEEVWFRDNNLCHMLLGSVDSVENAVHFVNNIQSLCETRPYAIPCNISSDPRHAADNTQVFNPGAGAAVSMWPETLGLAAAFDPELVKQYGHVVASEYRALGIATSLSPQIDLGTEPRWGRVSGTFGESPKLSTALAKAICEGFQTTREGDGYVTESGWGTDSIVAMAKHWPGGGPEEGGRDAHFAFGKYAVYPGDNLKDHLVPFTEGALKLDGGTEKAAAIMPYYTISYNLDTKYGENIGNAYSKYVITDLLRNEYGYDGVVCTDWGVTFDPNPDVDDFARTCWGVELISRTERFLKIINAGVDQFGDVHDPEFLIKAYALGVGRNGETVMRSRIEQSAVRVLTNTFRLGLFENPYLDMEKSKAIVGCDKFVAMGLEAQRKAIILLKNKDKILPLNKGKKVYIPRKYTAPGRDSFGNPTREHWDDCISHEAVKPYFEITDKPDDADFALVAITEPQTGMGYSREDREAGGNGYMPISLQYREYTADAARETSIAGGDHREPFINRSYKGKSATAGNISELEMLEQTYKRMSGKPVIALYKMSKPSVLAEVEPLCDAVIAHHSISEPILLEAVAGIFEPSGLLPYQMPANMEAVEKQYEDVPFDMECYEDSERNIYDFAFGMNWNGVIKDGRTIFETVLAGRA